MIKKFLVPVGVTLAIGMMYTPVSVKAAVSSSNAPCVLVQPNSITYNKIKFDTISYNEAPEALTTEIDTYKSSEGFLYYVDESSNSLYIAVLRGEKPTGGYGININFVEDVEGKENILVQETDPDKNSILPQLVTYPYTIIKTKLSGTSLSVKNSSGKVYNCLDLKDGTPNIVGSSWVLGSLKNIYTKGDFIFLEIEEGYGNSELFYVNNNDEWKNKIKSLKLNSTLTIQYALGTPQKYNDTSAFPLSEVNCPIDKTSLTDKNWENLKAYSNVPVDKEWTISFNQDIKKENITNSNIYVSDDTGNIIPTVLSLLEDNKSIKVIPYKPYSLGENYYLFINNKLNNTKSSLKGFRMNFQITDSISIKDNISIK